MFRHFVPSRELHSLATLVRLSLVDLPSANSLKCCSPPASLEKQIPKIRPLTGRNVRKVDGLFLSPNQALGKETIDTYNTSNTRGNSPSYGMNYQKLGKDLATVDELAVLDGGKCILQLRGVRPFLSDNYFYIIIDRDDEGNETVHFLNQVDEADLLMLMSEEEAAKYTEPMVETTPEPTETEPEPEVTEPAPVEKPKTNMIPAILALLVLAGGGGFFAFKKVQEKKKEKEAAKPDPDADYVGDDEDYGYSEDFEDDNDVDFAADEEDNEPV